MGASSGDVLGVFAGIFPLKEGEVGGFIEGGEGEGEGAGDGDGDSGGEGDGGDDAEAEDEETRDTTGRSADAEGVGAVPAGRSEVLAAAP